MQPPPIGQEGDLGAAGHADVRGETKLLLQVLGPADRLRPGLLPLILKRRIRVSDHDRDAGVWVGDPQNA